MLPITVFNTDKVDYKPHLKVESNLKVRQLKPEESPTL